MTTPTQPKTASGAPEVAAHTPGISKGVDFERESGCAVYVIRDTQGAESDEAAFTNCALFTAAPDLLAALEAMCKVVSDSGRWLPDEYQQAYHAAQRVITKAKAWETPLEAVKQPAGQSKTGTNNEPVKSEQKPKQTERQEQK